MFLISSVERPEDGAWAFNVPVTGSLQLARLTIGGDLFSQLTIPDVGCTPMCANSRPLDFVPTLDISPTSSSVPLPARKSAPPTAREKALRTIIYSGNGRVSSSKSDLYGVRLRTALAQELKASTGYSMRWLRRTTPSGHAWWVLTMPAPITSESECGSLLPTPSATSYGSNQGGAAGREGKVRPSLASMIPTPTVTTATQGPRHGDRPQKEGRILVDLLPTMLATPVSKSQSPFDGGTHSRERMAKLLGTPRASRGYDSAEFAGGAAPNPRKLIYTMLSTPRASDAQKGSPNQSAGEGRALTPAQLAMLPTPTARDTRSDRASDQTMARNSRPLSETSGSLGLTGTVESPVSQRRALLLGLVLWMMGQAPSWLRACATVPLPRSATRLSRKSQK